MGCSSVVWGIRDHPWHSVHGACILEALFTFPGPLLPAGRANGVSLV